MRPAKKPIASVKLAKKMSPVKNQAPVSWLKTVRAHVRVILMQTKKGKPAAEVSNPRKPKIPKTLRQATRRIPPIKTAKGNRRARKSRKALNLPLRWPSQNSRDRVSNLVKEDDNNKAKPKAVKANNQGSNRENLNRANAAWPITTPASVVVVAISAETTAAASCPQVARSEASPSSSIARKKHPNRALSPEMIMATGPIA